MGGVSYLYNWGWRAKLWATKHPLCQSPASSCQKAS